MEVSGPRLQILDGPGGGHVSLGKDWGADGFSYFNWIPTVPSFQDMKVEFKNKNVSGRQWEWLDSKVQM